MSVNHEIQLSGIKLVYSIIAQEIFMALYALRNFQNVPSNVSDLFRHQ